MTLTEDIRKFTVDPTASLEQAMARIEANGHRSVLVVDGDQRVLGSLSDGDIRKALLQHRLLSARVTEIMNTNFLAVKSEEEGRSGDLFARYQIFLLPVVDESNHLLKIITAY